MSLVPVWMYIDDAMSIELNADWIIISDYLITLKPASIICFFERLKSMLNSNIVSNYIIEIIIYTYKIRKEKLSSCYVNSN